MREPLRENWCMLSGGKKTQVTFHVLHELDRALGTTPAG